MHIQIRRHGTRRLIRVFTINALIGSRLVQLIENCKSTWHDLVKQAGRFWSFPRNETGACTSTRAQECTFFTLKGKLSQDTTDSVFFHDGALVIPIHKTFVNKYHGTLKRYNYFGRGGLLPLAHLRTAVILLRLSKAADLVNNLFIFEPCVKVSYHMSFVAKNKP